MASLHFTPNLRRHVACPSADVGGATLAAVLAAAFQSNVAARDYVLDDQGAVRKHITIFINGELIRDRVHLSDAVAKDDEIYVMQALSGG